MLWQNRKWVGGIRHGPGAAGRRDRTGCWTALASRQADDGRRTHRQARAMWKTGSRTTGAGTGTPSSGSWNTSSRRGSSPPPPGPILRTPLHPDRQGPARTAAPRHGAAAGRRGAGSAAAMDRLIDAAAQAHGIGTVRCFADYFRMPLRAAAVSVERPRGGRHGSQPVTVAGLEQAAVPARRGEAPARSHRPGAAEPLRLPGL